MKANEAPEKLYFGESDKGILDIYSTKESDNEIEYIRTDAFIEKVCEKLEKYMYDNLMFQGRLHRKEVIETFVENFKKYIEK